MKARAGGEKGRQLCPQLVQKAAEDTAWHELSSKVKVVEKEKQLLLCSAIVVYLVVLSLTRVVKSVVTVVYLVHNSGDHHNSLLFTCYTTAATITTACSY